MQEERLTKEWIPFEASRIVVDQIKDLVARCLNINRHSGRRHIGALPINRKTGGGINPWNRIKSGDLQFNGARIGSALDTARLLRPPQNFAGLLSSAGGAVGKNGFHTRQVCGELSPLGAGSSKKLLSGVR